MDWRLGLNTKAFFQLAEVNSQNVILPKIGSIQCNIIDIETKESEIENGKFIKVGRLKVTLDFPASITSTLFRLVSDELPSVNKKDSIFIKKSHQKERQKNIRSPDKKSLKTWVTVKYIDRSRHTGSKKGWAEKDIGLKFELKKSQSNLILQYALDERELRVHKRWIGRKLGIGPSINNIKNVAKEKIEIPFSQIQNALNSEKLWIKIKNIFGVDEIGEAIFGILSWSEKSHFTQDLKTKIIKYKKHDAVSNYYSYKMVLIAETDKNTKRSLEDLKFASELLKNIIININANQNHKPKEPIDYKDTHTITKRLPATPRNPEP